MLLTDFHEHCNSERFYLCRGERSADGDVSSSNAAILNGIDVRLHDDQADLCFYAFDVLYLNGSSLIDVSARTAEPLFGAHD